MGVTTTMNENTKVKDIIIVTEDENGEVNEVHPNCAVLFFALMESVDKAHVNWLSANIAYIDERLSDIAQTQAKEQVNEKFEEFIRNNYED